MQARPALAVHQVARMENEPTASKSDSARIAAEQAYARAAQEQETEIRKQLAATERKYFSTGPLPILEWRQEIGKESTAEQKLIVPGGLYTQPAFLVTFPRYEVVGR